MIKRRRIMLKFCLGPDVSRPFVIPMAEEEKNGDCCYIGLTDPSSQKVYRQGCFVIQYSVHRFLEMEEEAEGSFLTKETWNQIARRIVS